MPSSINFLDKLICVKELESSFYDNSKLSIVLIYEKNTDISPVLLKELESSHNLVVTVH